MRLAFSTGSVWTYGLARAFEVARRAGFDAVEVIVDERWDTRQPGYLQRLSNEHGLEITSLHAPFAPLRGTEGGYQAGVREALALADVVGAGTVVVHPESRGRGYGAWIRQHWDELQDGHAAGLAVENMPYRRVRTRPRHRTHLPEQLVRFPAVTLDTAHLGTADVDILAGMETVWPRLRHVHLSDYANAPSGQRGAGEEHLCPGDGELPLMPFLARLRELDYQGVVVLELVPEALPVDDEDRLVERVRALRQACLAAISP